MKKEKKVKKGFLLHFLNKLINKYLDGIKMGKVGSKEGEFFIVMKHGEIWGGGFMNKSLDEIK